MTTATSASDTSAAAHALAPACHIVPVIESQSVGGAFHRLRLGCAAIALSARPGQFVHLLPRISGASEASDPLLRRAFSIASTSLSAGSDANVNGPPGAGAAWFEILFRVGGRGTSLLARSRAGDELDVLGPLGNGFGLEALPSEQARRPLLLVGGGIGVPPMIFAAQKIAVSRETPGSVVAPATAPPVEAFVGARSASDLVGVRELEKAGARLHIATDDGSSGWRGLVTAPLRARLEELQATASQIQGRGSAGALSDAPLVCACGPWPMLKAVAQLCASLGVECRVSLEESMPCGVGVCNGCVVPVLDATDDYGRFRRICVQGPVLDARVVDWQYGAVSPSGPSQPAPANDDGDSSEHQGASQ